MTALEAVRRATQITGTIRAIATGFANGGRRGRDEVIRVVSKVLADPATAEFARLTSARLSIFLSFSLSHSLSLSHIHTHIHSLSLSLPPSRAHDTPTPTHRPHLVDQQGQRGEVRRGRREAKPGV